MMPTWKAVLVVSRQAGDVLKSASGTVYRICAVRLSHRTTFRNNSLTRQQYKPVGDCQPPSKLHETLKLTNGRHIHNNATSTTNDGLIKPSVKQLHTKIEQYSKYCPRPISLKQMNHFNSNTNPYASFEYLRKEIPTRTCNILKEISAMSRLGWKLDMSAHYALQKMYTDSLVELFKFEDVKVNDKVLVRFYRTLSELMSPRKDPHDDDGYLVQKMVESGPEKASVFLDRFFTCRISNRLLMRQHMCAHEAKFNANTSTCTLPSESYFSPNHSIKTLVNLAYAEACSLASNKNQTDDCLFFDGTDLPIPYVNRHLMKMLIELMLNAIDANNATKVNINCDVNCQPDYVNILIMDNGPGMSQRLQNKAFDYGFTTRSKYEPTIEYKSNFCSKYMLSGSGYGLPLVSLYTKYLGGQFNLASIEAGGTQACIHLRLCGSKANERLPVYNKTTVYLYQDDFTRNIMEHRHRHYSTRNPIVPIDSN